MTEEIRDAKERLEAQRARAERAAETAEDQASWWTRQRERNGWRRKIDSLVRGANT